MRAGEKTHTSLDCRVADAATRRAAEDSLPSVRALIEHHPPDEAVEWAVFCTCPGMLPVGLADGGRRVQLTLDVRRADGAGTRG
jgi:hypothetical protein